MWLGYKNYQLKSFMQLTSQNYIKLIPQARVAFLAVPQSYLSLSKNSFYYFLFFYLLLHPEAAPRLRAVALTGGKQILECPNQTGYFLMKNCIEISGEYFSSETTQRRADKNIFIYILVSLFSFSCSFILSFYSFFFSLNLLPVINQKKSQNVRWMPYLTSPSDKSSCTKVFRFFLNPENLNGKDQLEVCNLLVNTCPLVLVVLDVVIRH